MGELFSSYNPVKVYRVQSIGGKNAVMQLIKKVTEIAQLKEMKNTRKWGLLMEPGDWSAFYEPTKSCLICSFIILTIKSSNQPDNLSTIPSTPSKSSQNCCISHLKK
jgi:hypothetical protein